jgi:preprotein translocase subunit SecA
MAGMKEGEVIESGMLTRQIEKAQRKVESHNFDIRKQLLLFDDVANDQRKVVYQQRTEIMGTEDLSGAVHGMMEDVVSSLLDQLIPRHGSTADWDLKGLQDALARELNVNLDIGEWLQQDPQLEEGALRERMARTVRESYDGRVARYGAPLMRYAEKDVMLKMLDQQWRDHLAAMDYLRQGIHLRGYAQKDYRFEYKREAFELFTAMLERVKVDTVSFLSRLEVKTAEELDREEELRRAQLMRALQAQHADAPSLSMTDALPAVEPGRPAAAAAARAARAPASSAPPAEPFVRQERKIGRNEPCPCGSGKKYKHCHGVLSSVE